VRRLVTSSMTERDYDVISAGAGFCRIWNETSGRSRSRIFKLAASLL